MTTDNGKRRGRPPGRTAKGEATRAHLYTTAVQLIAEHGYEATTLRRVAKEAGVSPGLLYKYFPSKVSLVLALYDQLSVAFDEQCEGMAGGKWRQRAVHTLQTSLSTLRPHRTALTALIPVLVSSSSDGLMGDDAAPSRTIVQRRFVLAVTESDDAPTTDLAQALGRLLYVLQLGVLLFWVLDRSPRQRATDALLAWLQTVAPMAAGALWVPGVSNLLRKLDSIVCDGIFGQVA